MPYPSIERAATPVAFVQAILRADQRYGMSPAAALQQAQITPALLKQRDGRTTASQMELVSNAAMRELDDEALDWFSRRLPWGSSNCCARTRPGRATPPASPNGYTSPSACCTGNFETKEPRCRA